MDFYKSIFQYSKSIKLGDISNIAIYPKDTDENDLSSEKINIIKIENIFGNKTYISFLR